MSINGRSIHNLIDAIHIHTQLIEFNFVFPIYFKALGKIPVDAGDLDVDYLTIVGHKFYGPRIGALYVRGLEQKLVPVYPMLYGGGQERGYRSG